MLVNCNIVNNDYQQDARVPNACLPNNPFGTLLEISPTNFIPLKTINSEFLYIEVWFTNQNSQPLAIEDNTNLNYLIKPYSYYKNALFNLTKRSNIKTLIKKIINKNIG